MSNNVNTILYEELAVWLEERGYTYKDIQKDSQGYYVGFYPEYLPEPYQELL